MDDYPRRPLGDALQHHLKLWADRYPFTGETKGSSVIVEPGRLALVVTSNYDIDDCFSNEEDREALKRRFNVIHMTKANQCLIKQTRIDWDLLTNDETPVERQEPENLEEYMDLALHEQEEAAARNEDTSALDEVEW
jgi:hypothetical protein